MKWALIRLSRPLPEQQLCFININPSGIKKMLLFEQAGLQCAFLKVRGLLQDGLHSIFGNYAWFVNYWIVIKEDGIKSVWI